MRGIVTRIAALDGPQYPATARRIADIRTRLDALARKASKAAPFARQLAQAGQRHRARTAREVEPIVRKAAARWGVDAGLIRAVIRAESAYNPAAVSRTGAMGLMQLMPATAAGLGVRDPFDPVENINAGTRYLRSQLDAFGDVALALAAYNAGPAAVRQRGGVPDYPETRAYVQRVLTYWQQAQSGP